MKKYVAILHDGEITIHLPCTTGNYATLCGDDGDDPSENVDLVEVDVPTGKKINCSECRRMWYVCKRFTVRDFAAPNKA